MDIRERLMTATLAEHLRVMPAVVLTGARQTGKSTLASRMTAGNRTYVTLDDVEVRGTAQESPDKLLQVPGNLTLDEVQRVPDLLLAIKRAIDLEWLAPDVLAAPWWRVL